MRSFIIVLLVGVALAAPSAKKLRGAPSQTVEQMSEVYNNHRLMGYTPTTEKEVKFLKSLEHNADLELDFWTDPVLNQLVTFRVPPNTYPQLKKLLRHNRLRVVTLHENIKELMKDNADDAAKVKNFAQPLFSGLIEHTRYYRYQDIDDQLQAFANGFPNLVRKHTASPSTVQGRSISYIEISRDFSGTKPVIFIEGGIHAREWISPAVVQYFVDRLLHTERADDEAKRLLDNYDWVIAPVTNPDGYEYTHTNSRLWRKNRNSCQGGTGIDLNRNFDAFWGTTGVSSRCTSDTYPGTSAMSERESQAIRNMVDAYRSRMHAYISFHSYSQYILTPYAYKRNEFPPNGAEHKTIGSLAADALRAVHGKNFVVGTAPEILYEASGSSADWAGLTGIEWTWTYELRPSNSEWWIGFELPPEQIIPSGEETWKSLVVFADEI